MKLIKYDVFSNEIPVDITVVTDHWYYGSHFYDYILFIEESDGSYEEVAKTIADKYKSAGGVDSVIITMKFIVDKSLYIKEYEF